MLIWEIKYNILTIKRMIAIQTSDMGFSNFGGHVSQRTAEGQMYALLKIVEFISLVY